MKKRTLRSLSLLISVIALVGVACGSSDDPTATPRPAATAAPAATATPVPTSTPDPDQPKYGGIMRVGTVFGSDIGLDPAIITSGSQYMATLNMYQNLTQLSPDLQVLPDAAASWEANADASGWTFRLVKGAKFTNGKTLVAEDVVFTFNRLLDEDIASPARSVLGFIENIVAVDENTVRFELEGGNAFFPDTLSMHQARILPSNVDVTRLTNEDFGSGAFISVEYSPGERQVLERNPDYFDSDLPYLNGVTFVFIEEAETRVQALLTGGVDAIRPLDFAGVPTIENGSNTRVSEAVGGAYLSIAMDARVEPFSNKLVRKALQVGIDREAIRQGVLFGHGEIGRDHPIPSIDPHFDPSANIPSYDPVKAKELLAQAGYPDGIDITLSTAPLLPGMVELAVVMKEVAAASGIRITVNRTPTDGYYSKVWMQETTPFNIVYWGQRNPDQAISVNLHSEAPWNDSFYNNPVLDSLLIKARAQSKLADRQKTYGEIQRILIDDVPRLIPIMVPNFLGLRDDVRGLEAHPSDRYDFLRAWLDR